MIEPGAVAYSRRGPALTSWGKAAVVGAGLLLTAVERTGPDGGVVLGVAAAIVVACLVDACFAFAGFRARVLDVVTPPRVHVGDAAVSRIRFDGNQDLLATIPGFVAVRPSAVDQDGVATITAPMSRRSVQDEFLLQVLRAGPLGLAAVTQRAVVALSEPLVVLPPPAAAVLPPPPSGELDPTAAAWSARGHGSGPVQQLREHQHGDGLRSVNWLATARRGDLVVVERDPPERGRTHVVVDLGEGCPCGEAAVARALTVVGGLLARGDDVVITARTTPGARARAPRLPYGLHRLALIPPEVETVELRSLRDAEVVLGRAVGGPVPDLAGPAYVLSPTGDRWDDGSDT